MGVEQIALKKLEVGEKADVRALIRNFGRGPALRVRQSINGVIATADYLPPLPEVGTTISTLFPDHETGSQPFASSDHPITEDERDGVKTGRYKIWVIAHIVYEDASGRKHHTKQWATWDHIKESFAAADHRDEAT